jgi:hypothetical protein
MQARPILLGALLAAALLTGCGSHPAKPLIDAADIQDAAEDMEESRLDYQGCLKDQEDEPDINCDEWKEIYEDDQDAYEWLIKRKKAQGG